MLARADRGWLTGQDAVPEGPVYRVRDLRNDEPRSVGVDSNMIYVCIIIVVAIIAAMKLRDMREDRNGEWHHTGAQMRRFVDGRWEYREMTQAEANEWKDMTAW